MPPALIVAWQILHKRQVSAMLASAKAGQAAIAGLAELGLEPIEEPENEANTDAEPQQGHDGVLEVG